MPLVLPGWQNEDSAVSEGPVGLPRRWRSVSSRRADWKSFSSRPWMAVSASRCPCSQQAYSSLLKVYTHTQGDTHTHTQGDTHTHTHISRERAQSTKQCRQSADVQVFFLSSYDSTESIHAEYMRAFKWCFITFTW